MDPLTSPHREGSVPVGPGVFFDMIVKLGNLKNYIEFLKIYIESVHEKFRYPCNLCEYKALQMGNLKIHIESVHEKIKYPCINVNIKLQKRVIQRLILNQSMRKSSIIVMNMNITGKSKATLHYGDQHIL